MLRIIIDLGAVEQGFGRDATFVEADAAEGVLLEEDDLEAGRAGALRGYVSAGAGADDG